MDPFIKIDPVQPVVYFWKVVPGNAHQKQDNKKPGYTWNEFFKSKWLHRNNLMKKTRGILTNYFFIRCRIHELLYIGRIFYSQPDHPAFAIRISIY